jgi:hypothetical protein
MPTTCFSYRKIQQVLNLKSSGAESADLGVDQEAQNVRNIRLICNDWVGEKIAKIELAPLEEPSDRWERSRVTCDNLKKERLRVSSIPP